MLRARRSLYVIFTAFWYQRRSAESNDPAKPEDVDEDPRSHHAGAPYPVRTGGLLLRLWEDSLSPALLLLFAVFFVLHWISSARENCREQSMHGEPCAPLLVT
jgi:hypothetical protein